MTQEMSSGSFGSRTVCWLLAITVFGSSEMYGASNVRLLWTLKSSAIVADRPGKSEDSTVRDLAYSPDGNWIAAVGGPARTKRRPDPPHELVIVPSTGEADRSKRIHLDHFATTPGKRALYWSADSTYIAVRLFHPSFAGHFTIFRASDGEPVYSGIDQEFSGFIDSHRFLVTPAKGKTERSRRPGLQKREPAATSFDVLVYDLDGTQQAAWAFASNASGNVEAFGPPLIASVAVIGGKNLSLVNPLTGKLLSQDRDMAAFFSRVQFGDGGRSYCIASVSVRCFDVDTGNELLPRPPVQHGEPFDIARDVPVLATTDSYGSSSPFAIALDLAGKLDVKSVVVWDLRRGLELAQIKGQKQRGDSPARVAVAPLGNI